MRERLERALRLARRLGVDDYCASSCRFSAEEPEWFWPVAIEDMGIEFSRAVGRRCSTTRAGPSGRPGSSAGRLDRAATACTAGPSGGPTRSRRSWLREDGVAARAQLRRAVARGDAARRGARPARRRGRATGSRSSCRCRRRSRSPRTPARTSARSRCPIFSGFARSGDRGAAPALARRRWSITADGSLRRGREVPMLRSCRRGGRTGAVGRACGRRRGSAAVPMQAGRDVLGRGRRRLRPASSRRSRSTRRPVSADVHLRDDRPAEGRPPRAGRLPRLDRARGRLPGGRAARRRRSTSSPTWAGSWVRGTVVGGRARGGRSSSPRARPTGRRRPALGLVEQERVTSWVSRRRSCAR